MSVPEGSDEVLNEVEVPLVDDNINVENEEPAKASQEGTTFLSKCYKVRSSPTFTLCVVLLAVFVDGAFYSIVIPLLPDYMEELKVDQVDFLVVS